MGLSYEDTKRLLAEHISTTAYVTPAPGEPAPHGEGLRVTLPDGTVLVDRHVQPLPLDGEAVTDLSPETLAMVEQRVDTFTSAGRDVYQKSTRYPVLSTARRLELADVLRLAASRIVAGEDPGQELERLQAALEGWRLGL